MSSLRSGQYPRVSILVPPLPDRVGRGSRPVPALRDRLPPALFTQIDDHFSTFYNIIYLPLRQGGQDSLFIGMTVQMFTILNTGDCKKRPAGRQIDYESYDV
jgi:hypothetical protein